MNTDKKRTVIFLLFVIPALAFAILSIFWFIALCYISYKGFEIEPYMLIIESSFISITLVSYWRLLKELENIQKQKSCLKLQRKY